LGLPGLPQLASRWAPSSPSRPTPNSAAVITSPTPYRLVFPNSVTYHCQFRNHSRPSHSPKLIPVTDDPKAPHASPNPAQLRKKFKIFKENRSHPHIWNHPFLYRIPPKLHLPLANLSCVVLPTGNSLCGTSGRLRRHRCGFKALFSAKPPSRRASIGRAGPYYRRVPSGMRDCLPELVAVKSITTPNLCLYITAQALRDSQG
jgi:hypothetical protein